MTTEQVPLRRLGLLGGSFNPVHIGHLILARDARERFNLDQVLFVPCACSPHKSGAGLADGRHRLAMLRAALQGEAWAEVSDIELGRPGPSFTIDTVRELKRQEPATDLVFVVGADALAELHLWKDVYALLELCRVAVHGRPGFGPGVVKLRPPWPERIRASSWEGHRIGLSATEIRRRVAEGLSVRFMVPDAVDVYIREHGLYRPQEDA